MMPATPVDQHLGEFVLGGAARSLGREHRRVALPCQRLADDLGQGREYRVLQLRGYQPDEPFAALAQTYGPFVAEHVERGQYGLAGGGGDARLPVQDPADGRFAHPRLRCDVGKPCGHGIGLYRPGIALPTERTPCAGTRTARSGLLRHRVPS